MRAVLIPCSVLCLALAGCDQPKWRGDGPAPAGFIDGPALVDAATPVADALRSGSA
jgi:hypothetical protein